VVAEIAHLDCTATRPPGILGEQHLAAICHRHHPGRPVNIHPHLLAILDRGRTGVNAIRTFGASAAGHSATANARCARRAQSTASSASENTAKNESPAVATSRPLLAAIACRMTR
jgi:hypothetical protein